MTEERHVSLFRDGRNQAVRIPREFEMPGSKAIMRKDGDRLIIEPLRRSNRLLDLLKTLEPMNDVLPEVEDPPVKDEDIP